MKDNKSIEKTQRNDVEPTRDARMFTPATDIYEKEDAVLIRCDMPGVTQDQIDLRLDNTELEITGTQSDGKPNGVDLLSGEYQTGVFRRKFSIPQLIDRDGIKAHLNNGVLNIALPKAEQAKPRKIEIANDS